jgi:hypothetical protein
MVPSAADLGRLQLEAIGGAHEGRTGGCQGQHRHHLRTAGGLGWWKAGENQELW